MFQNVATPQAHQQNFLGERAGEIDKYLTDKELQSVLSISRTTLWRLRHAGLPIVRIGRRSRYELEQVKNWLKSNDPLTQEGLGNSRQVSEIEKKKRKLVLPGKISRDLPPCHWSRDVALDPKHRPQLPSRPASTVRREWWRYPQEAHLLDEKNWRFRRITAAEVAILQGFPADWGRNTGLSDLDLIRGYGNAVPPPLAAILIGKLNDFVMGGIHNNIEICAGFGGIALGGSSARTSAGQSIDINHIALIDFWKPAVDVLRNNGPWSRESIHLADATQFEWDSFKGKIDLLSGGPPCQPWSQGGLRKGDQDERDLLGYMPELIGKITPKAFLFENVPGLLSGENEEYVKWLIESLRNPAPGTSYGVGIATINAADFGVPQVRRRVFIVGIRGLSNSSVHQYFDSVYCSRTHADARSPFAVGLKPWVTIAEALPDWAIDDMAWRRWIDMPQQNDSNSTRIPESQGERPVLGGAIRDNFAMGLNWPSKNREAQWSQENGWSVVRDEEPKKGELESIGPWLTPTHSLNNLNLHSDPWYISGDHIAALDVIHAQVGRSVSLLYLDAPRLHTDAAKFASADQQAQRDTWLTLIKGIIKRAFHIISDEGVICVLAGLVETPYIQIIMDEIFGPINYVGTIAWQKTYSPQNMPNVKELYYSHDNIVVFAKRKIEKLSWIALEIPIIGDNNPDSDPRGSWIAQQKGANKPDCDYAVNLPP